MLCGPVWAASMPLFRLQTAHGKVQIQAKCAKDGRADHIYLLGWWLDMDIPLSFKYLHSSMRQVQIRAVVWKQALHGETNEAAVFFINNLATATACSTARRPYLARTVSRHQKVLVATKNRRGLVAFCGGIDINADRILVSKGTGSPR